MAAIPERRRGVGIPSKSILEILETQSTGRLKLKKLCKRVAKEVGAKTSDVRPYVEAKVKKLVKRGRVALDDGIVKRIKRLKTHTSITTHGASNTDVISTIKREESCLLPRLICLSLGGHLRPFNLGVFEDGMGFLIHRHEIGLSILEREHLSQHAFETAGYGVTTPFDEWNYVLHENNPRSEDARNRSKPMLDELMSHPSAIAAGLTRSELISLRLVTGPMIELYSHYLAHSHDSENPRGVVNPFAGTCQSIAVAIGKLMHVPKESFSELYRIIYHSESHADDLRSAAPNSSFLEIGFMPASLDDTKLQNLAISRDEKKDSFSVISMVINGGGAYANVEWLSQQPKIFSCIFPSLCSLTLTGQQRTRNDGCRIISAVVSSQSHHTLSGVTSAAKTNYLQHVRGLLVQFSDKNIPATVTAPLVSHLEDSKGKESRWFDAPTNVCDMHVELAANYKKTLENLKSYAPSPEQNDGVCHLAVADLLFSLGDYDAVIETLKKMRKDNLNEEALEKSARCYELLAEAYEMREQAIPLDEQHFYNLDYAASLYEESVKLWRLHQSQRSGLDMPIDSVRVATALMKFGRAKARSTNRRSKGFNDEVRDINFMLHAAKAALNESTSLFRRLRHSFLPLSLKSFGMVQHNLYRNQPGYRWGAATGPAHGEAGDAAFQLYRESADILQGDAERSLDYAESLTCCGAVFDDRGMTSTALPYRLQSAAVQEANFGRNHPASQKYRTTLASCLERLGRHQEAEEVRNGGRLLVDVDPIRSKIVDLPSALKASGTVPDIIEPGTSSELKANFYILHDRDLSRDTARLLRGELSIFGGYNTVWMQEHPREADEMCVVSGISSSEKVIMLLTKGMLHEQYAMEIKVAIRLQKPIIFVHESDERRRDYISLPEILGKLSQELNSYVESNQCLSLARSDYEITALMQELCSIHGESTRGLSSGLLSSRRKPLPMGCQWHIFISHYQMNSGDQCHGLASDLESMGYSIWFDQNQNDLTEQGMMEGVRGSAMMLLFLNESVLTRNFVQREVREGLKLAKKFILVNEVDGRHGAPLNEFGGFDFHRVCVEQAPKDLRLLHVNHESISFQRRKQLREAMLQMIVEKLQMGVLGLTRKRSP